MIPFVSHYPLPRGWSARFYCHHCGEEAVARLIYIRESDGNEEGRSRPKCHRHYIEALDIWKRLEELAPDALDGLVVTVSAP